MKIGTKSILFGCHQFAIHPWFVAYAWWKLYGFPWDPRLWVAFFVHDLGYWGKPNMDGPEGERHVEMGAHVMSRLFDKGYPRWYRIMDSYHGEWMGPYKEYGMWGNFSLLHSRFYAKKLERPVSQLCYADKFSIVVTPRWLYFFLARLTGEHKEYLARARGGKYKTMNLDTANEYGWHADMCAYLTAWVAEHKDGKEDTWTPSQ